MGTPSQNVEVLISTASDQTWVVVGLGCTFNSPPSDCASLRGNLYNPNVSSTWTEIDIYVLNLESNLNYTGNGEFGFDTVALGWQGSGGPNLTHQIVGGIADTDFFLGYFGLTPRPTNFTTFNDPHPSYLHNLKNQSLIPSESWGYTAGAHYRKLLHRGFLTHTTKGIIRGSWHLWKSYTWGI